MNHIWCFQNCVRARKADAFSWLLLRNRHREPCESFQHGDNLFLNSNCCLSFHADRRATPHWKLEFLWCSHFKETNFIMNHDAAVRDSTGSDLCGVNEEYASWFWNRWKPNELVGLLFRPYSISAQAVGNFTVVHDGQLEVHFYAAIFGIQQRGRTEVSPIRQRKTSMTVGTRQSFTCVEFTEQLGLFDHWADFPNTDTQTVLTFRKAAPQRHTLWYCLLLPFYLAVCKHMVYNNTAARAIFILEIYLSTHWLICFCQNQHIQVVMLSITRVSIICLGNTILLPFLWQLFSLWQHHRSGTKKNIRFVLLRDDIRSGNAWITIEFPSLYGLLSSSRLLFRRFCCWNLPAVFEFYSAHRIGERDTFQCDCQKHPL